MQVTARFTGPDSLTAAKEEKSTPVAVQEKTRSAGRMSRSSSSGSLVLEEEAAQPISRRVLTCQENRSPVNWNLSDFLAANANNNKRPVVLKIADIIEFNDLYEALEGSEVAEDRLNVVRRIDLTKLQLDPIVNEIDIVLSYFNNMEELALSKLHTSTLRIGGFPNLETITIENIWKGIYKGQLIIEQCPKFKKVVTNDEAESQITVDGQPYRDFTKKSCSESILPFLIHPAMLVLYFAMFCGSIAAAVYFGKLDYETVNTLMTSAKQMVLNWTG